jgi:alpha-galactosidase
MTATEYRAHLSLWSLLAAPLLAGNDLRSMPSETAGILTNREVVAIDQDALGKQGYRVAQEGANEVWAKPLAGGEWAIGLFNRGPETAKVTVRWKDFGLSGKHRVRDLWAHHDRGNQKDQFWYEVPSHGVVLLRVK